MQLIETGEVGAPIFLHGVFPDASVVAEIYVRSWILVRLFEFYCNAPNYKLEPIVTCLPKNYTSRPQIYAG